MEKTRNLDELFQHWENAVPGYKKKFVKDGIIDEVLYNSSKLRILFVTKEPNNPEQEEGDFREWWQGEAKYTFSYRVAEWAYGILHDFPPYDELWVEPNDKMKVTLRQIALMNIKKCGGSGTSNWTCMMDHAEQNKSFIEKQIEIIEPQIIIAGLSWNEVRDKVFSGVTWKDSGYDRKIGKYKNSAVIDFYHPSSRSAPAAVYSLLQNIVKSEAFQSILK